MFLYHIRRKQDEGNFTKGYIGISDNPARRFTEHKGWTLV